MNITLVKGEFTAIEAINLLTEMVAVKIRFHETKIEKSYNEEDIKMREQRIKQLQMDLAITRQNILTAGNSCNLDGVLKVSF